MFKNQMINQAAGKIQQLNPGWKYVLISALIV